MVCADFNADGRVDIYVANDQMPNHLWVNNGDGTFRDQALERGCALNESGRPEAGMGVAMEDVDGNGDWDLFMTHFDDETNTFYRNTAGLFQDVTDEVQLGAISKAMTGFGVGFLDYDCDGYFDLFIANGRVRLADLGGSNPYAQSNQLLQGGVDGRFHDVSFRSGSALALAEVSRGAAFGDYDNDGDVDILVSNNDGPVRLFRNDARGDRHWLSVQLVGRTLDRDGMGARVAIEAGGRTRQRLVQAAYSYGSSNDPRVHFGLGDCETVDAVTVTWPDGHRTQRHDMPADQFLAFKQPGGDAPLVVGGKGL